LLGDDIFGEGNIANLFAEFESKHICAANEFCIAFGITGEFNDLNAPTEDDDDNVATPDLPNAHNQVGDMDASNSLEGDSDRDAEGSDD